MIPPIFFLPGGSVIEMQTAVRAAFLVSLAVAFLCVGPALADDATAEKPKIEVAFVGVAHIHTPEFISTLKRRASEVTVKYVWDHDADRAKRAANELGATVVDDPSTIWNDPQIKAVIICSETALHLDLVLAAAKAHKNIYAEKPIGISTKDAYEMARAIDEAGVLFETGYFMRGDPKILFIRDQIAKGTFGTITRIRGSNTHSAALGGWFDGPYRWMADPKQSGFGGFGDLGTHTLDIMLWLLGDVSRVTAVTSNGVARYPDCDEYGTGLLLFKSGAMGDLSAGWDDIANPVTLEVCGTKAHATIVNNELYFSTDPKTPGANDRAPVKDLPQGWSRPMDLFIDALTGKPNVPLVTADEAAYRSAVTDALYKAASDKTWVEPEAPLNGR
jgi:predicted dehydrogenase